MSSRSWPTSRRTTGAFSAHDRRAQGRDTGLHQGEVDQWFRRRDQQPLTRDRPPRLWISQCRSVDLNVVPVHRWRGARTAATDPLKGQERHEVWNWVPLTTRTDAPWRRCDYCVISNRCSRSTRRGSCRSALCCARKPRTRSASSWSSSESWLDSGTTPSPGSSGRNEKKR